MRNIDHGPFDLPLICGPFDFWGHGVVMSREDLNWHIDYLAAVKQNVQAAIDRGLGLDETVKQVALPGYRGYALFDWVHAGLNVPVAYKDLKGAK